MNKKIAILTQIVLLFVIPFALIASGLISFYFLIPLAIFGIGVVTWDIKNQGWTSKKIGFRLDNITSCLIPYTIFTVVGLIITVIISNILGKYPTEGWWTYSYYYVATIPFSFTQEFLYRGYLMEKLKLIFGKPWQIIVVNGLLFAFLHTIYPDALMLFPFGFAAGVAFATIYHYYPNIILITISHVILNLAVISRCYFSPSGHHGC